METVADHVWKVLTTAPSPRERADEREMSGEGFSERFRDGSVGPQACHHLPSWEDKGWQVKGVEAKGVASCGAPSWASKSHPQHVLSSATKRVSHLTPGPALSAEGEGAGNGTLLPPIHQSPPWQQFLRL